MRLLIIITLSIFLLSSCTSIGIIDQEQLENITLSFNCTNCNFSSSNGSIAGSSLWLNNSAGDIYTYEAVGIGINNPQADLDVNGSIYLRNYFDSKDYYYIYSIHHDGRMGLNQNNEGYISKIFQSKNGRIAIGEASIVSPGYALSGTIALRGAVAILGAPIIGYNAFTTGTHKSLTFGTPEVEVSSGFGGEANTTDIATFSNVDNRWEGVRPGIRYTSSFHNFRIDKGTGNGNIGESYLYISSNGNIGINNTEPSFPLEVIGNTGGITAYFEKNISVEDVIYHSDVNTEDNVLETFNNDYIGVDGEIEHSKDSYAYVEYTKEVIDYDKPQITIIEEKECDLYKEIVNGEEILKHKCELKNITKTIYPYKKNITVEGWSVSKRNAKYEKALAEINKALSIYEVENKQLIDTDILSAEAIYTESKTADKTIDYLQMFDDNIYTKENHPAYEDIAGMGRLSVEDRIVILEGALKQQIELNNKLIDIQICILSSNNFNQLKKCSETT